MRLHLPHRIKLTLDLISSAFGFRNLASAMKPASSSSSASSALAARSLSWSAISPKASPASLYNLYFKQILPRIGGTRL